MQPGELREQPRVKEAFTEIRVHGIGDHEYHSSLGEPSEKRLNAWVQIADPPPMPAHRLRILNWSRSHRRRSGFLWYLAFPFTLVNVAGRMSPATTNGQRAPGHLLRAVVHTVGLVLTLTQLAWLIVLGETAARHLPVGQFPVRAIAPIAGVVLTGWLLYRYRTVSKKQDAAEQGNSVLPVLHGAAVLGTSVLLAVYPPAQLRWEGWPSSPALSGGPLLDAMALWICMTSVLAIVAALVLTVAFYAGGDNRRARVPLVAAGLMLVSAVLLMHSLTALVRMLLDNFLVYVTGLFGAIPRRQAAGGILLAYDDPAEAGDSRLDLFPFLALIWVLAAVVAFAVVLLMSGPRPGLPPLTKGKAARGRWWHEFASAAPRLLPVIVPLAVVFGAAGMAAAILLGEGRLGGPWLALAILLLQFAGGLVVLVMLLGQLRPVREVLGKIADIAGFWPVRDHPLAGSSYRRAATAAILDLVQQRDSGRGQVVLVAHSQGSVICAWLAAQLPDPDSPIDAQRPFPHLVTTGSPLSSLYAVFFPGYFTPEFFERVNSRTLTFFNFWRDTDPVAFPVAAAENRRLPDPRADGTVRSHGDYWAEPAIIDHVSSLARDAS